MRHQYWTKEDFEQLAEARSFTDLAQIAMNVLKRTPKPIGLVSGPISTGGLSSIKKNLEDFDRCIQYLLTNGINVFDQLPFEEPMQGIKSHTEYDMSLLEDFYLPILESGYITHLYLKPDWQTSKGATWEHEQARRAGITVVELPEDWDERTDYLK